MLTLLVNTFVHTRLFGIFGHGFTDTPTLRLSSRSSVMARACCALRFAHCPLWLPQLVTVHVSPSKDSQPLRSKLAAMPGSCATASSSARVAYSVPSAVCSSSHEYRRNHAKTAFATSHPQSRATARIACLLIMSTSTFNHLAITSPSTAAGLQPSKKFQPSGRNRTIPASPSSAA